MQIQIYSPKGWIVAVQAGVNKREEPKDIFIGIQNVDDRGDVAPRWNVCGGA